MRLWLHANALVLVLTYYSVYCQERFIVSFQRNSTGTVSISTDEWIEFRNEIPSCKEFTACHWIRIRYYNKVFPFNIWSYCTIEAKEKDMECVQLWLDNSWKTANRNVKIVTSFPPTPGFSLSTWKDIEVENILHRTWIHI